MKILKASTKAGQNILRRAEHNEGYFLSNVYSDYSRQKENAWKWCEYEFLTSNNHSDFHICSHNTYGFTVAWYCTINDEKCLRFETKDNRYIVYLER